MPMRPMEKLGQQLQTALAHDIPAELTALVVTTSNPKRLQELFRQVSAGLLEAHRNALMRPSSVAAKAQRERSKALLDLVRARIGTNGIRKPSIEKMMAMLATKPPDNLVEIRRVA